MAISTIILFVMEAFRVFLTLTYPLCDRVLDLVYRLLMGPKRTPPPIEDKLLLIPVVELAEKIRKRQLRCQDVMRAYIQRSKRLHPYINAVVDSRYELALQEAKEVDRFLSSGAKDEEQIARDTPLLGVPFSCKEVIGIKGLKQTNGLVRARNHVADEDCHAAAECRKAGAIPVTVTNVPELSMWWETANVIYGLTLNPYDHRRTVGGSTGGEAALLSAAGAVMGIGTDIGGSIRIPSSFCGIYGHKPSKGIVSNWGAFPHCHMTPDRKDARPTAKFVSTGPMCRYASDLPLLLKVMSANDKRLKLDQKVDFRKVKVYYMKGTPGIINAARLDVRKAIVKAAKHFEEEYGIQATALRFDELQDSIPIWLSKFLETGLKPFTVSMAGPNATVHVWWELLKSVFRRSDHTLPAIFFGIVNRTDKDRQYHAMLDRYEQLEKKFKDLFEEDAILLYPTHPEPAPHYLMSLPKFKNIGYTCIFNILGLPCTNVPAGQSGGLPIGIQAISGRFNDHLTIAAAMELEKVFGGWKSPSPIRI